MGAVSIGASSTDSCAPNDWASAAQAEAQNAGVDITLYQHKIYVLPSNTTCTWSGRGSINCGDFCRVWVAACQFADVYAHELGHNLDMHHASTDTDNDKLSDGLEYFTGALC